MTDDVCLWRWNGAAWQKVIGCPSQSGLFCPDPEGEGGFIGDTTTTPCGGP